MTKQTKASWNEDNKEQIIRGMFEKRQEIIDLFCKTFIVTELKDYEHFKSGSLELVITRYNSPGGELKETYRCAFIDPEEQEKFRKDVVIQKMLEEAKAKAYKKGFIKGQLEYVNAQNDITSTPSF